jgi:putative acetyltransferase
MVNSHAPVVIIRREIDDDYTAIFRLHADAFHRSDGVGVPPEAPLVDELRAEGSAIPALSLVALADEEIVGHVMCSRGDIEGSGCVALGPIGVVPDRQGAGIGSALMHAVIAAADARDEPAVVLLGDPRFYRRFGFVLATSVGVTPSDPNWIHHLQVRTLAAWGGAVTGTFRYPPAFDRL